MRILALSDTYPDLRKFGPLLDNKPDVVVLAGDYDEGFTFGAHEDAKNYDRAIRRDLHAFLEYATKHSRVLVIKGNHEEGRFSSARYYHKGEINSIKGCTELSGRRVTVNGIRYLGINFANSYKNNSLLPLLSKYDVGTVDIVITHCDISKLLHISKIQPKLIIRGHASGGPPKYLVNEIPVISTGGAEYCIIQFSNGRVDVEAIREREKISNMKWFKDNQKIWLKPWT